MTPSRRAVVRDLGPGPPAEELTRRAAGRPGLVCLRGGFADGRPLLTSHPLRTIDTFPADEAATAADDGVVGGGWFGVAGHDEGRTRFAWHDHVVRLVDGRWRFEALWTADRAAHLDTLAAEWRALLSVDAPPRTCSIGDWQLPDRDMHLAAVERAIELIRAGELYQANVCTRLSANFAGDPAALFAAAAESLDPAFGALITHDDGTVVCLSPELFWRRRGRTVVSAPIKGTLPVGAGNAARLRSSAKDVAENVMIVDLVRNDLGRVCVTGSVRVTSLLDVVERVGVLHLESTVAGTVTTTDAAVHTALFPPASVTGTPKLRALAAIADLEYQPRGVYTGAVGFVSPCWGAEFAVAIRTFEVDDGRVELGVGGGITVDSVPVVEWQECLHKAGPLLVTTGGRLPIARSAPRDGGLLETILAVDGVPLRLADHLARLDRSARELYGRPVPDDLVERVRAVTAGTTGRLAVRVVLDGAVDISVAPLGGPPPPAALVTGRRDAGTSWRHKWADRSWLGDPGTVFVAADGTVLETDRGSVVLLGADGSLVAPPLRDDLLPGVTRRALLDHARDVGRATWLRTFGVVELTNSVACWTSSLSGAVPIASVDGVELPRNDAAVAGLSAALGIERVAAAAVVS